MLTAKRLGILAGLMSAALLANIGLASAGDWYGDVDCGQTPYAGCELGAGQRGPSASGPRPLSDPYPDSPNSPGRSPEAATPPPGDRIIGGGTDLSDCSYVRSDYQPPATGMRPVGYRPRPTSSGGVQFVSLEQSRHQVATRGLGPGGAWYVYRCSGPGVADGFYRAPVWLADGPVAGPAPSPSPEELALQARSQLRLPNPTIGSSPAGTQLVRVPTWLWLDRAMWHPQSATASVPGISVTATATPASVSWSMGDGASVTCAGPGTPFPAGGDPQAVSPDCGHTYQRSSAIAPGERYPATAIVRWRVSWSGAAASGTLPDLTTSGSASFRVAEAQALGIG